MPSIRRRRTPRPSPLSPPLRDQLREAALLAQLSFLRLTFPEFPEFFEYRSTQSPVTPLSEDVPPAPRLVGIETNPGPPKKTKSVKVVRVEVPKRMKTKKVSSLRGRPAQSSNPLFRDYLNTLNDPFEYPPVPLGYDCMVNTELASGYFRRQFQTNADGSFGLWMGATVADCVHINNSGINSLTWEAYSMVNTSSIQAQAREGRVISGGMRVIPLVAGTDKPGVLLAGSSTAITQSALLGNSPGSLSQRSNMELGLGSRGCEVLMRPIDNTSYEFWEFPVMGYPGAAEQYTSNPLIIGVGFPANTSIWVEAILNLEILPQENGATVNGSTDIPSNQTVSDSFPSVESLYKATKTLLTNPVVLDAAEALAGVHGLKSAMAARVIRTAFGRGRNAARTRTLASGAPYLGSGSVLVEEISENNLSRSKRR